MGQEEIAKILSKQYPRYLSYLQIIKRSTTSKRSVLRCLSKLQKRDEVEYKLVECDKSRGGWIKLYRNK